MCSRMMLAAIAVLFAWIVSGCAVTQDKIDTWADSVGGEARIAEAVADPGVDMPVRVYGMIKLIKIEQFDLLVSSMKKMEQAQRLLLIKNSASDIGKLFQVPDIKVQAAAKDTLFLFLSMENKAVQDSSKAMLLNWYKTNFKDKYGAGRYSASNVLKEMGDDAADTLAQAMKDSKDTQTRVKIAKIVESIASPKVVEKVSDLFVTWLNEQTPNLDPGLLQVLCFARDDRVTQMLNHYVVNKDNPYKLRLEAMNTLTFHPSKLSLPMAIKLFIDKRGDMDFRAYSVDLIKKIGDREALKYLPAFLKEEAVKWATSGAILKIDGANGVDTVLKGINPKVKFVRDDYDIARRQFKELGPDAAPVFEKYLKAKHVPLVAMALIGLQYTGDKALAEKSIKPLFEDKRDVKGYMYDKPYALGQLAKAVYGAIQKRPPQKPAKAEEKK